MTTSAAVAMSYRLHPRFPLQDSEKEQLSLRRPPSLVLALMGVVMQASGRLRTHKLESRGDPGEGHPRQKVGALLGTPALPLH